MYSYKCITTYNGSRYNGWQRQGNTSNTIQGKLEDTLSKMFDEIIEIAGSGRTDAGVHAVGQVFNFHCSIPVNEDFIDNINHFLPQDIRIVSCEECSDRFHSRLHAVEKVYQYRIDTSPYGNPFIRDTSHNVPTPLNIDAMKNGASYLIGTHDFKSFCSNKRMKKTSVRTINDIQFDELPNENLLLITYRGNGFLYNMVRIITGTLIEIGLGLRNPDDIPSVINGLDRSLAGHTAPAKGLFLMQVYYKK